MFGRLITLFFLLASCALMAQCAYYELPRSYERPLIKRFRGEPIRFGKRAPREPIRFGKRAADEEDLEQNFVY